LRALVTGGTGFVGSHVARALVDAGHTVRILHRKTSRLDALAGLTFESALGDILDADALRVASEGCDWVFHVAAVADYWRADVVKMFEANVEGTRRVLQAAQDAGVKRVVFTSSAGAVGLRDDGLPADESHAFNLPPKRFPYGYSKSLAEGVVRAAVENGQDVVTVNPVVVMGPGDLNMISGNFVTQIKRFGRFTPVTTGGVAVIDVRDVARQHLAAAERGKTGERYILGAANVPYPEWFAMIADVVGAPRPFLKVPGFLLPIAAAGIDLARKLGIETPVDADQTRLGARNLFFDYNKARRELGEPQIDMRRSLEDTYAWYVEHGYIKP
jgi:dihydroflavonol-4-reductase